MAVDTRQEIEETFGLVPEMFERVPDYLLPTEWASFKSLVLSGAERRALSAMRAAATSAESSWLVAVTVKTLSRERSTRM
jgi:hypothetical protein